MLLDMTSKRPLTDAIRRTVLNKKVNLSIIITSASEFKTQMRKSTTGLALSYGIQPEFNFEKQFACIDTEWFLEVLGRKNLKRGSVLFLDEFGVGMDHYSWRDFLVRSVHKTMETYGHEGRILIVTVPVKSYVDKDSLKLFNIHIEILRKNDRKRYAVVRVKIINYNDKLDKIYERYPRGKFPDGRIRPIAEFRIKYPDKEKMKKYFDIAKKAKVGLKDGLKERTVEIRMKKLKSLFNPEDYVDVILKNPQKFVVDFRGYKIIKETKIMNEFLEIGGRRAKQLKDLAEERLGIGFGVAPQRNVAPLETREEVDNWEAI